MTFLLWNLDAQHDFWLRRNNDDITTFARKNAVNIPSKLGGIMAKSLGKILWGFTPWYFPRGFAIIPFIFRRIFGIFPCKGRNIVTMFNLGRGQQTNMP